VSDVSRPATRGFFGFNLVCETFFSFKFGDMAEKQTFLYMLPNSKARKAVNQSNSETKGEFEASYLACDITLVAQWPRRASYAPRKAVTRKRAALQTTNASEQHFRPQGR
jgi:hypothetical protein